jgi:ADP-ribose pyrophosphatase
MKISDIEILSETWLHRSFLKLKHYRLRHRLFSGDWSDEVERELVARPSVSAVLPYDPILDQVVLIEQFRMGPLNQQQNPWLMEVVAGVAEGDESLEELAKREMLEEAGLAVISLKQMHHYWVSPGMCDEQVALFCAQVDARNAGGIHGLPEEHEDIKVHVMAASAAFELAAKGHLNNAMSLIAIQWLQLNHADLRKEWLGEGAYAALA